MSAASSGAAGSIYGDADVADNFLGCLFWIIVLLVVALLIVEFWIGVDLIAFLVGNPVGDTKEWLGDMREGVEDAVKDKARRIKDAYENR